MKDFICIKNKKITSLDKKLTNTCSLERLECINQKQTKQVLLQYGASLVEYALILGLIALLALGGITTFGNALGKKYCDFVSKDHNNPVSPGLGAMMGGQEYEWVNGQCVELSQPPPPCPPFC